MASPLRETHEPFKDGNKWTLPKKRRNDERVAKWQVFHLVSRIV
jgi:hypothetical protein